MGRRGQGGGGVRLKGRAAVFAESEHKGRERKESARTLWCLRPEQQRGWGVAHGAEADCGGDGSGARVRGLGSMPHV